MHQNDGGCHGYGGYGCVKGDAELTMVGVDRIGVQVCDLRDREGRQQNEAEARHDRKKKRPAALITAGKCLNCCQIRTSTVLFYQDRIQFDVLQANWFAR